MLRAGVTVTYHCWVPPCASGKETRHFPGSAGAGLGGRGGSVPLSCPGAAAPLRALRAEALPGRVFPAPSAPAALARSAASGASAAFPSGPGQDGGGGAEEEANLPQIHLPRGGPGPAARHVLRAADAAVQCAAAAAPEPRPAPQAALAAQAPAQGQEGGAAHGEARGGEDPPEGHDHPARDGGQHGGRLQRQDLQPGGDQARDDRPLPGRVLHHVQASEARPAWHRCHPLLPLHPAQVAPGGSLLQCK